MTTQPPPPPPPGGQYLRSRVMVVTTDTIPGYRIDRIHGDVFGITVRARNLFSNIGAGFRTIFGGEARGYTRLVTDSREQAIDRLREAALAAGCNAVVAMRFDSGDIGNMLNEIAAYGTAVVVVPDNG